jgi:proteasome lid subunit RPN8/RPN11
MEVMGLMLGEFVDDYTVRCTDVFAMPQSGTGVSVEAVDPVFQTKMLDMLKQTGRCDPPQEWPSDTPNTRTYELHTSWAIPCGIPPWGLCCSRVSPIAAGSSIRRLRTLLRERLLGDGWLTSWAIPAPQGIAHRRVYTQLAVTHLSRTLFPPPATITANSLYFLTRFAGVVRELFVGATRAVSPFYVLSQRPPQPRMCVACRSPLVDCYGALWNHRPEMVVGWYHSHPGFGCWLSGVDINTQQSFEALNQRAVAVVIDPIQSVKGKVVIDAFRLINPQVGLAHSPG